MKSRAVTLLMLLALFAPSFALAGDVGPGMARAFVVAPDTKVAAWVTFRDRAGAERDPAAIARARETMAPRAALRRSVRAPQLGIVAGDLPVHAPYVRALVARGAGLRGTSRWLNAASVNVSPREAQELARLPFVASVELVPRARRISPVDDPEALASVSQAAPLAVNAVPGDSAYYGLAWKQLKMMQVPQAHAAGWTGAGVLVCMLDGGFRTTHNVYATLNVLARRDFVNGDSVVDDEVPPDVSGEGSHGTATLSAVAANLPGVLTGVAYDATVALGKTEYTPTETPVEMDNWQRGMEWADSLGADIISSSLGYFEFDPPYTSYTYADMDGKTTVVTQAAREAIARGIVVVNAAGNEGASPWHYIIAPADADTVIAVGAVDSTNTVRSFSSRGPTADNRIKPDVTAPGYRVWAPTFSSPSNYQQVSGTSFSCPLTAGVAALVLQAHPTWGPFEVREALRETALNHAAPNNDIGWGLVQALDAIQWIPSTTDVPSMPAGPGASRLALHPNPAFAGSRVAVDFTATGRVSIALYDARGRMRAHVYEGNSNGPSSIAWTPRGDGGGRLEPGVYWLRLSTGDGSASAPGDAKRLVILP